MLKTAWNGQLVGVGIVRVKISGIRIVRIAICPGGNGPGGLHQGLIVQVENCPVRVDGGELLGAQLFG